MDSADLPKVIILKPSTIITLFQQQFSQKFDFLKAWESPLPLSNFLSDSAESIKAMLCCGRTLINVDVLGMLPSLKLVVTPCVGLNHIDLDECRRRGIAVANAGSVFSDDVADSAVGLLIDVMRRLTASDGYIRSGVWPVKGDYPLGFRLSGKRVGIVGLGPIGLEVAKRLEAFGCSISYNSRKQKPSISYTYYETVVKLAANCKILVICCALNDQTRHFINKDVLSALGKEGIVVNIARGAVIDEKELAWCLVEGEILGAGLDVFEHEPDVPKELFALENVVLSPHVAFYTEESMLELFDLVSGNLEACFANKPLLSQVMDY